MIIGVLGVDYGRVGETAGHGKIGVELDISANLQIGDRVDHFVGNADLAVAVGVVAR